MNKDIKNYLDTKDIVHLHNWLADNKGLVAKIAIDTIRKFGLFNIPLDDMVQEAYIAFYKVMPNYSGEYKVSTYLHNVIPNELINANKREARIDFAHRMYALDLDKENTMDDGSGASMYDIVPSDSTNGVDSAMKNIAWELLIKLVPDANDRQVIEMYAKGYSYREIGKHFNRSHEWARCRVDKFIQDARQELGIDAMS